VLDKGLLNGTVDPLLLAGSYAPLVTVSEWYARELLDEHGADRSGGLGKALLQKGIPLTGITNGIDPVPYDPRGPVGQIPFRFDPSTGDLDGKRKCRQALGRLLGRTSITESKGPLYAFVGRLTGQKGIDVLYRALQTLAREDAGRRFIVLGRGEKELESMLSSLADESTTEGRLLFLSRYDAALASLIYAASDFFLIPSVFEPCGLTDFIAQLRGSIPVVHRVGGLKKVRDGETGFSYEERTPAALCAAVERTSRLFHEEPALLERIRRTAFSEIFALHTWDRVLADSYLPLYESLSPSEAWTPR
jgi:starch synthase